MAQTRFGESGVVIEHLDVSAYTVPTDFPESDGTFDDRARATSLQLRADIHRNVLAVLISSLLSVITAVWLWKKR